MTEQTRCPACGGRSSDAMLCAPCVRAVRKALRQIVTWWPTLVETITRQARLHAGEQSGAIFRPLAFDDAAARVADEIHADLVGWVRMAAEVGAPMPELGDTPNLALHLAAHLPELRRHEAADSLPTVDEWPRSIRRVVDYPDERGKIRVGPCPEKLDDETTCPGVVWARFYEGSHYDEAKRPTMTCEVDRPSGAEPTCGRVWPAEQWREASNRILARMEEQRRQRDLAASYAPKVRTIEKAAPLPMASIIPMVTIPDASAIYVIPEGTIWRWLSEGKLWPFGTRGARLVSAWQVADVGEKHRRFPKESRAEGPRDPIAARILG